MPRVQVYKCLSGGPEKRGLFSIRNKETGRVQDHGRVLILNNARFIVQPGGVNRVLREGRKNVHAWVEGDLDPWNGYDSIYAGCRFRALCDVGYPTSHYDPYRYSSFVDQDELPIKEAETVILHYQHGVVYVPSETVSKEVA